MEGVRAGRHLTSKMKFCLRALVVWIALSMSSSCGSDGAPVCGNAVREGSEVCDLGYGQNGLTSSTCSASCTYQTATTTTTSGTCCRSNTTGQYGYCSQLCTSG